MILEWGVICICIEKKKLLFKIWVFTLGFTLYKSCCHKCSWSRYSTVFVSVKWALNCGGLSGSGYWYSAVFTLKTVNGWSGWRFLPAVMQMPNFDVTDAWGTDCWLHSSCAVLYFPSLSLAAVRSGSMPSGCNRCWKKKKTGKRCRAFDREV